MNFFEQLQRRRKILNRKVPQIAATIAMAPSNVYAIFSSGRDVRASTLAALAASLDAQWVLVPRHLLPEVERLMSGKRIGPDDVPTSIERMLGQSEGE